ncbi:hypothetical protein VNO77_05776 [Canavalia gladiata]|uniref:Uncharacterized protein n=1 Tax=Canavalia gladiata TaxID=3824 RepID=A0AAN9MZP5_CANGL
MVSQLHSHTLIKIRDMIMILIYSPFLCTTKRCSKAVLSLFVCSLVNPEPPGLGRSFVLKPAEFAQPELRTEL